MSSKYPGGIITKNYTAPTPTSASGIWTLDQQEQAQQAGIWPYGGPFTYIEDVFSTYLYTGNGSTQSIVNNIDLSTKGGLAWIKKRDVSSDHRLTDTLRGVTKVLSSNNTSGQATDTNGLTAFNTDGFSIGSDSGYNTNASTYASWTFRKQPKFFDVVTFTTPATAGSFTVSHSLGSAPGFFTIKSTATADSWYCYHKSLGVNQYILLNTTGAAVSSTGVFGTVTSTGITLNTSNWGTNVTYVMYLFADNAGGFGLTGTDNVISCGSLTTDGSGVSTVNLGYEPQWVLLKSYAGTSPTSQWIMFDNMRGWTNPANNARLFANLSNAETSGDGQAYPTATGFGSAGLAASTSYIYIAIRRGPMKVPTDATKVFKPISVNAAQGTQQTTGFPVDLQMVRLNAQNSGTNSAFIDRLRGVSTTTTSNGSPYLASSSTAAESTALSNTQAWGNTGFQNPSYYGSIQATFHNFRRAPNFFDEVICTQTGSAQNVTHNLGVAPELLILKDRTSAVSWQVGTQFTSTTWNNLVLNSTAAGSVGAYNNYINAQPTSTVFRLGPNLGSIGDSFVAYLFASCPGVSKVGSYTGTGTLTTINCGFTGGARFVMIKRTDTTSDWFVWDTARGMVAGTDPSISLNQTFAESNANSVYTIATGFQLLAAPSADVNTNGGTYIYLAIA